jgi:hypothetical protein
MMLNSLRTADGVESRSTLRYVGFLQLSDSLVNLLLSTGVLQGGNESDSLSVGARTEIPHLDELELADSRLLAEHTRKENESK